MSQTISSSGTRVVLDVQCHLSSFPKEEIIDVFPLSAIQSDIWGFFLGLDKCHLVLIAFVVLKEWFYPLPPDSMAVVQMASPAPLSISSYQSMFFSQSPEESVFLQARVGGCFSFLFKKKRQSFPVWPEIAELFMVKLRPL